MKPEFMQDLVVQAYKPYEWLLFSHLQYWTLVKGKPELIEVPAGFRTDLASIPRLVRSFIPQNGRHRRAAVVHDYLYRYAGRQDHHWTRKQADDVFREAMEVDGVPGYRRFLMYSAVRSWGWNKWRKSVEKNS